MTNISENVGCETQTPGADLGAVVQSISPETSTKAKKTILVVDDEEMVREILMDYLNREGYNVITAENGNAAIEQYKKIPNIDLAFMDMIMPEKCGYEAIPEILKIRPQASIVIMTGFVREEDLQKVAGYSIGMLHKPLGLYAKKDEKVDIVNTGLTFYSVEKVLNYVFEKQ